MRAACLLCQELVFLATPLWTLSLLNCWALKRWDCNTSRHPVPWSPVSPQAQGAPGLPGACGSTSPLEKLGDTAKDSQSVPLLAVSVPLPAAGSLSSHQERSPVVTAAFKDVSFLGCFVLGDFEGIALLPAKGGMGFLRQTCGGGDASSGASRC